MTATKAPTPGPLSASDIAHVRDYWSAICDSDWHLIPANIRDDLEERLAAVGLAEWRAVTDDDLEDTFAYERGIEKGRSCLDLTALGHLAFKSDADGWMPWSGGENPVPGQRVQWRTRNETDRVMSVLSNNLDWTHECRRGFDPIIAFRLAPTAPVEAPVVARAEAQDEDTPCTDCGDTGVTHQTERRCSCQEAEAQDEGAEMTRLLKLADSALANVTAFEDDARYIMGNTNYAITENARSEIRSFLLAQSAKTSVRPKALEILERLLDHSGARGSFDAMKHGDAVKDAEELLRSARSPGHTDLMVTPESIDAYMRVNPMEAQDEGAAGVASAYRVRMISNDPAEWVLMHPEKALDFLSRKGWESQPLYAHPSPTPAADADRVRIAVEALEVKINAPLTGPTHGAWDRGRIAGLKEALAALKSEGK